MPFGTIANFKNGINYTRKNLGKGIKVINVKDFQDRVIAETENLDEIDPKGVVDENAILKEGDILLVRSNGNRQLIGRSIYVSRLKDPVVNSAFTIRVRVKPQYALPRFYAYLLRSSFIRKRLSSYGGGTNISNLNQQILRQLPVPLPSMDEQSNIADVLSTYDSLIGNNVRRIQVLEKMTKLIYNEWFVKFKFPDHEKVRLFDSRPGDIPEGWETVELGAIADENRRSVEPNEVDPDTPYVGLEHLSRNSITLTEWGVAKESLSSKMRFRKDEILFGKIRPYFHKVATAPVDGICSTDIIVVSPKAREYLPVVLGAVSSDHFIDYATTTSQGTKMPRANWSVLKRYPVSIPPSRLLQEADALVRDIVDLLNKLMFENRNLKKTRDLLLPRLISGETKVSRLGVKGTGMEA